MSALPTELGSYASVTSIRLIGTDFWTLLLRYNLSTRLYFKLDFFRIELRKVFEISCCTQSVFGISHASSEETGAQSETGLTTVGVTLPNSRMAGIFASPSPRDHRTSAVSYRADVVQRGVVGAKAVALVGERDLAVVYSTARVSNSHPVYDNTGDLAL